MTLDSFETYALPGSQAAWNRPAFLFARVEGRVRPFDKWLRYDLEREPLAMEGLLEHVDRIRGDCDPFHQRLVFREVERLARAAGHGAVVDSWEPNVPWLRGEVSE